MSAGAAPATGPTGPTGPARVAGPAGRCSVGIDIGGTFTDVVAADAGGILATAKRLTTPGRPAESAVAGVIEALAAAGRAPADVDRVVHGTTLVTNTILEHRGGRIAFVTTRGFRHLLALGRHARVESERYDLAFRLPDSPVPLERTFEVEERLGPRGEVITPLDLRTLDDLAARVAATEPTGVAVCLLHAHTNPAHEIQVADALRAHLDVPVIRSTEVSPEAREYERATTTVMSALAGPVMAAYLHDMAHRLDQAGIAGPLYVMESSGGMLTVDQAVRRAIATVESGPAAGVVAAQAVGRQAGSPDVIAFDMGGTTAKAAVITGGEPTTTREFQVGGRGSFGTRRSGTGVPIRIPTVDLAEVGAGGGSIAWLDSQGSLQVGPRSAGADPGPACYGLGGTAPTVTDADAVLGYLDLRHAPQLPDFDIDLARRAVGEHLATPLGVAVETAAAAVHDIANALMAGAIDVVTVQRGIDPRRYALVSSGGAGPVHAARVAERFGITRVIVPPAAGVASAAGLLVADLRADVARPVMVDGEQVDLVRLDADLDALERAAAAELGDPASCTFRRSIDLRYRGQTHALTVEISSGILSAGQWSDVCARFTDAHRQAFGSGRLAPVEIVQLRVRCSQAVGPTPIRYLRPEGSDRSASGQTGATRPAWSPDRAELVETPVLERHACRADHVVEGPAVIESPESTLWVPPGWRATLPADGSSVLERQEVPR